MLTPALREHLQTILQDEIDEQIFIKRINEVRGGDISHSAAIITNKGKFFVKLQDAARLDMFRKEYHGLQQLAVPGALKIPAVYTYGVHDRTAFLLMEHMEPLTEEEPVWERLARGLAGIHRFTESHYGLKEQNYIGSLPQSNRQDTDWHRFFSEQRILPLVRKAMEASLCTTEDMVMAELLCYKLPRLLPVEAPSLLHGDFWSGNFMFTHSGMAAVFDPAVYYGHREADIAMSLLFGGFDERFYQAYHEVFPLEHSWRERMDVYQLYPLLVHLLLFGKGYYSNVSTILRKYS